MKKIVAILMGICLLTGCNVSINGAKITSGPGIKGSGKIISREMEFEDFTKIDARSNFEVEITKGDAQKVEIFFDDNIEEYLDVNVAKGELTLDMKKSENYKKITIRAVIQMPVIEELDGSGNTDIDIEGDFQSDKVFDLDLSGNSVVEIDGKLKTDKNMEIDLSGNSKFEAEIECKDIDMNLSGNSKIQLEGLGENFIGELSGNSGADCSDLILNNVDIELNGNADAKVKTDGEIKVDVSGNADLYYYGNGTVVSKKVSGNAGIHKK